MLELWNSLIASLPALKDAWGVVIGLVIAAVIAGWVIGRFMYGQRIEDLKERVQLRDDRVREYDDKLKGASPEQAGTLIAALEKRLAALEPRRLTEQQIQTLTNALRESPSSITLVKDAGSPDAGTIYAQLDKSLVSAGWKVNNGMAMGINGPPPTGIAVITQSEASRPAAKVLGAALRAAQIPFDEQSRPDAPANDFQEPLHVLITSPASA